MESLSSRMVKSAMIAAEIKRAARGQAITRALA